MAKPRSKRPELVFEEKGNAGVATSLSRRITTLDQLIAAAGIDLAVWEVERYVVNKWEVGSSEKDEIRTAGGSKRGKTRLVVAPLFQVKAWLRRRAPQKVGAENALRELIAEARTYAPKYPRIRYAKTTGAAGCLAEISVPDAHIGKLCWAPETGEHYDVAIAERIFMEAVARLRDASLRYGVERFLFPIGNDYFQSDNIAGTTTSGTPVDNDGRWQKSFTHGRRLLVRALEHLLEKAPVDVVHVPGNHDYERSFYLAEVLAAWFRNHRGITFDLRPTPRKYVAWGNTLLGFTHGDKERERALPLIMATEQPQLWSAAKYREFHLGHVHHKRERVYQPLAEDQGVRLRWLSSLSAADAWHVQQGYRGLRSAQAFLWHRQRGCIAELSHNL